MRLEGFKEFYKNLVLSLLSLKDIRVLLCVVDTLDIANIDDTTAIFVHLIEGLHCNTSPGLVHFTSDCSEEFVVVNATATISIESLECDRNFLFSESHSQFSHGLGEFFGAKSFVTIIVINAEFAAHTDNAGCTTRLHFIDNLLNEFASRLLLQSSASAATAGWSTRPGT